MSPLVATRAGASARGFGWSLAAGASGAFESIATVTASGGETSLTFSSIPQNYVALQIRGIVRDTATSSTPQSAAMYVRLNADTGTNYAWHWLAGNGASVFAGGAASQTLYNVGYCPAYGTGTANIYGALIIDIHDYANTTRNKTLRAHNGVDLNDGTTNSAMAITSGLWASALAVTSVSLLAQQLSFAAGTTFALYGIKGAA